MNCPYRSASELGWNIQGWQADLTSRSLRRVGGARLSCPMKRHGASIGVDRTRQAGPPQEVPPTFVEAIHELPLPFYQPNVDVTGTSLRKRWLRPATPLARFAMKSSATSLHFCVELARHGENLLTQLFHEFGMTLRFVAQGHTLIL